MLSIRNKYLLVASVIALLLGAVLLWPRQSSRTALGVSDSELSDDSPGAELAEKPVPTMTPTDSLVSSRPSAEASPPLIDEAEEQIEKVPEPDRPAAAAASGSGTASAPARPSSVPEQQVLSRQVFDVISEVQDLQQAGKWEDALQQMNALYREFDTLNPFEQATLLNFYTNTLFRLEMWQESITAFNLLLQVPDVRPDISARALLALGQLHAQIGERPEGVAYLTEWLNYTAGMAGMDSMTPRVNEMLICLRDSADVSIDCAL